MKISELITALKEFPQDMEIKCCDAHFNNEWDIFKITEYYDEYDTKVYLTWKPYLIEDVKAYHKHPNVKKNWYNPYDKFELRNEKGDCIVWSDEYCETTYSNIMDYNDYERNYVYESPNFRTVGGLKNFLKHFKDNMKINITLNDGATSGVIHKIHKKDIGYLVGNYDYVDEEIYEELFFEYGEELYNGDTISLKNSNIPYNSKELIECLSEPIRDKFIKDKINLTDKENLSWGEVLEKQRNNLYKYYTIHRRLNASRDSNGYYHLFDEEYPFMIYGMKNNIYGGRY